MTQGIAPYSRQVRVLIGPVEEWRGGGNAAQAISLDGDGTQEGFRIKFSVHKHVMSTATPTVIQVYNLGQDLRNALCKKSGIQIALFVGWANTEMTLLFTGSLLNVVTKRQGGSIVTDLLSNAAFGGMSRTVIAATFAGGMTIKSIVEILARQIPGVIVDSKNITINPTTKMGSVGFSVYGAVNEGLDKLARSYGFNWRVENKLFYANMHNQPWSSGRVLVSPDTGLVRAEPMLAGPMQQKSGVSIHSLLNPYISPGGVVNLQTVMNPNLNGDYIVHSLSHCGDTHGSQWDSMIESWVIMG